MKLIYGYLTSMAVKFQAAVSIQGFAHPKPRTFFYLVIESLMHNRSMARNQI